MKGDDGMITDLLKFTIKEEFVIEAEELFRRQMENNLGDEGCLMSKTFRSKQHPGEFYLLLCWQDPEAIENHLKTEHDNRFRENLDPMLACPPEFFDCDNND